MSKPEVKVGQEWQKEHNDGPTSPPTRIRVLDVGTNRHEVATVTEDGRLVRKRSLISSAFSNTPSGYALVKDVGETTPRTSPETKAEHPTAPCRECGETGRHKMQCGRRDDARAVLHATVDDPHAAHCTMDACKYGDPKCTMAPRALPAPPSAPSPLEVVRKRLHDGIAPCHWRQSGEAYECDPEPQGARCVYCKSRDTVDLLLATLEEFIRADIAEKVFAMLRGEEVIPGRTCKVTVMTWENAAAIADAIRGSK